VRPEKMTLTRERPATGSRLRARVNEVVYLGTSTNYTLDTGLGELVVYQPNAGEGRIEPERGDSVWAGWPVQHCYQLVDAGHDEEDFT